MGEQRVAVTQAGRRGSRALRLAGPRERPGKIQFQRPRRLPTQAQPQPCEVEPGTSIRHRLL